MATPKKPAGGNRSNSTNPPKGKPKPKLPGNAGRKPPAKRKPNAPAATPKPKNTYRRARNNPGDMGNAALLAIGGGLVIGFVNLALTQFLPQLSVAVTVGALAAAGLLIGWYGKKIPFIGQFAGVIWGAFWLLAFIKAWDAWIAPWLMGLFGMSTAPAIPGTLTTQQIKDTSTGEIGMRYNLVSGEALDYFPNRGLKVAARA